MDIGSKKEQDWIALTNLGRNLSRSLSSICCDIARNKSTLTSTSGFPKKSSNVARYKYQLKLSGYSREQITSDREPSHDSQVSTTFPLIMLYPIIPAANRE